ncbi:MAG: hypothetical protein OD814_001069 [Candidatus Alkanophagales archaeon MCA70_species_1]|nr:hypothetical protein [Candidatus Alkanophaga volatiphilum]
MKENDWRMISAVFIVTTLLFAALAGYYLYKVKKLEEYVEIPRIPLEVQELKFMDVWEGIVEYADINESNAYIGSLLLEIDKKGNVKTFMLEFWAENRGYKYFHIESNEDGMLRIRSYTMEDIESTLSIEKVFKEIDRYGLVNFLKDCEGGATIYGSVLRGSAQYDSKYVPLYLLEGGERKSLPKVEFDPWDVHFPIKVFEKWGKGTTVYIIK